MLHEITESCFDAAAKADPVNDHFPIQIEAPRPTNVDWNEHQESRNEKIC